MVRKKWTLERIVLRSKGEYWRAEAAACVLGWLAYPGKTKKDLVHRVEFKNYAALMLFRRMAAADIDWASQPQAISPGLLLLSAKKISGVIARAEKAIFPRRLLAGDMLGQLLSRDIFKEGPLSDITVPKGTKILLENGELAEITHPEGAQVQFKLGVNVDDDYRSVPPTRKVIKGDQLRKITTNMLAASLAKRLNNPPEGWGIDARKWKDKDVYRGIWSPSKPVAHLGLSLLSYIKTHCGSTIPDMEALLEGNWLESVLFGAEMLRQEAVRADYIAIEDAQTVRVLFDESSGKIPGPSTRLVLP